jgi:hypothetical protein
VKVVVLSYSGDNPFEVELRLSEDLEGSNASTCCRESGSVGLTGNSETRNFVECPQEKVAQGCCAE